MLFNSLDFAIFLPIVFLLYWHFFNKNLKIQNIFIVIVSYIFYGWWDWRFLSLIFFSTLLDYLIGIGIGKYKKLHIKKLLLLLSLLVNLGFLGFFKYYNFFLDNINEVFSFFGNNINIRGLEVILPVGISFYTFQTLSYSIDIYRNKLKPTKDLVAFTAFVSFFPQLVAGPIERASNLLPQFYSKRVFNYSKAVDGMRQILWGLFKKIVIADSCAEYVNIIFENPKMYSGSSLFVGGILFSFQIYGDFSGYSDIAIGVSRLFGFNLMKNFDFPYFSRDISEFWRKWHISLSTWFKDYVYIPMGGSKRSKIINIRNVFVVFLLSGLWHGANWTFLLWGFINALYFIPLMLFKRNEVNKNLVSNNNILQRLSELILISINFIFIMLAWIVFRSDSIEMVKLIFMKIFSFSLFQIPEIRPSIVFILIIVFTLLEWVSRKQEFGLQNVFGIKNALYRKVVYVFIFLSLFFFSSSPQSFIYFQF